MCLETEEAVDHPGVEPEFLKPGLRVAITSSPYIWGAELMDRGTSTEPMGRLAQRPVGSPRRRSRRPGAPALLEVTNGVIEFIVENIDRDLFARGEGVVRAIHETERGECGPDLHNLRPAIAVAQHLTLVGAGCQAASSPK